MATQDEPKATSTSEDAEPSDEVKAPPEEADEGASAEAPDDQDASAKDAAGGDAAEDAPAAPKEPAAPTPIKGAAWADPIAGFEQRWTWLESRLLTFVLVWQLLSLVAWVLLSGIAAPPQMGDNAGTTFRAVIAAIALGVGGWLGSKKLPIERRRMLTLTGIALGIGLGLALRPTFGATSGIRFAVNRTLYLDRFDALLVEYFGNIKGWLQEGSTLTLMGGLRGLATRLTLWLALLGASVATAAGKHIHIDVIFRFLPKRLRVPAAIINYTAAATVCFAGAWGFVDHLAIESFDSKADDAAGAKIANVARHMGEHAFLTRKQIGLDLRSLPRVLSGARYDQWMSPDAWNAWVESGGFEDHYKPDEIKSILVPADSAPHPPLVMSPSGTATRGLLVHDLNFVFPFGLVAIGLRFLLRALLTVSGHIPIDPDAAHKLEQHGAPTEAVKAGGA